MTQKKIKLILYLGMIFLVLSIVKSVPMPYGIDGYVFGLDNTLGNSSVKISIFNINTSYFVQGNLRDNGYYSASVFGESGHEIIVSAWTSYNHVNRSFIVENEMHGYNLTLNLSYPQPLPPEPEPEKPFKKIIRRRPRVVLGLINMEDQPAEEGLEYIIKNLETGDEIKGEIQDKYNAFAEVIEGNEGDLLEIFVGNKNYNEKKIFPITGEVIRNDIDMNITNLGFKLLYIKNTYGPYALGFLLFILIAAVIGYRHKRT